MKPGAMHKCEGCVSLKISVLKISHMHLDLLLRAVPSELQIPHILLAHCLNLWRHSGEFENILLLTE